MYVSVCLSAGECPSLLALSLSQSQSVGERPSICLLWNNWLSVCFSVSAYVSVCAAAVTVYLQISPINTERMPPAQLQYNTMQCN